MTMPGQWGAMVYSDAEHTPVPRVTVRCKAVSPEGKAHVCKMHEAHTSTEHRCICGKKWAR